MPSEKRSKSKFFLVTGGGGFVGRTMVAALQNRGHRVRVFDIAPSLNIDGIEYVRGDLRKLSDVESAVNGVDGVFHVASPPASANNRTLFYEVNVNGTKNVIAACKSKGVKKLIMTSSASVVYDGGDLEDASEDTPYPEKPLDYYTETKMLAEQEVLKANEPGVLHTVAIRPHSIYGPNDVQMVPQVAAAAKAGKSKYIIGNGKNITDVTYVDNVVHGHLIAEEKLGDGSIVNGKAYFITDGTPLPFWEFMTKIITGLGYPAPSTHLPASLMYVISLLVAFFVWILSPIKNIQPTFTPSRIAYITRHHYYNISRAKKELGYAPVVNQDEAMKRTLASFTHLRKGA